MPESSLEIMECTLRDGSYAVDFKFTERDTQILATALGQLGFKWIEVGHGLGLGASKAGKGAMPASDEKLIESAKAAAPGAKIGSFFIPGIGTYDQLESARSAGLDFVRIGYNATGIEEAYPYLTFAKELGLVACLNFMKTYGVSPAQFGEKAKHGAAAGADIVYCVDSAGSMFPDDVSRYFEAAAEHCQCRLGFHGHSNLQFAVANSIQAYRSGATFIDTTLYGLGRSAGNVPTEVAVAVFNRLGVDTGIDLFACMDAADEFLGPMMPQMQLYDMMSVAMGYSQFHSSFLPKVAAAAQRHKVDLRRLVVAMGELDPVSLDEIMLERVAANLPKKVSNPRQDVLRAFAAPGISSHSISASLASVRSLVDGIKITCAKRRARPVLELAASDAPSADLVLADLVLAEGEVVLGRVTYGSYEIFDQVIAMTTNDISIYLVDCDGGPWAHDLPARLREAPGSERFIPIRSQRLLESYLDEVLMSAAAGYGDACLLIYGNPQSAFVRRCAETFRSLVVYGVLPADVPPSCWQINDFSDRMHVQLGVTAALMLCPPTHADALSIDQLTAPDGVLISLGHFPRLEHDLPGRTVMRVEPNHAYRGHVSRWMALANLMKSNQPRPVAIS